MLCPLIFSVYFNVLRFHSTIILICEQVEERLPFKFRYHFAAYTKSSKPRTIKPPAIAFEYLRNERKKQLSNQLMAGEGWCNKYDLLFTNQVGTSLAEFSFYNNLEKIFAEIGRPDARPHDLRHTAATVAIASGADIKSVQSLLGHATASFTLNVYTHTSEKIMDDTAQRVQGYCDQLNTMP